MDIRVRLCFLFLVKGEDNACFSTYSLGAAAVWHLAPICKCYPDAICLCIECDVLSWNRDIKEVLRRGFGSHISF
jgi:hypothetical protein